MMGHWRRPLTCGTVEGDNVENDVWGSRIYTRRYDESVGGILLCGINPGDGAEHRETTYVEDAPKSFFSDTDPTCQNGKFPYQRRIREWFRTWGHPLDEAKDGPLERSISQANWIGESTRYAGAFYEWRFLVERAGEEFFPILEAVRPRMILFFGVQHLPRAFADPRLRDREVALFGAVTKGLHSIWKERASGKGRFRATAMSFERCQVLGLPHPTPPSRALANEDVAKLGPEFSAALAASGIIERAHARAS